MITAHSRLRYSPKDAGTGSSLRSTSIFFRCPASQLPFLGQYGHVNLAHDMTHTVRIGDWTPENEDSLKRSTITIKARMMLGS